ncbi:restriction endonuclease subunit S [Candidatus Peregrinibacteria bacterium]|jgi:type I restriction enzyme, S subunit|nr:restriction endonuclease subunit S [Candidatus Peregrinibacteria bacterium]
MTVVNTVKLGDIVKISKGKKVANILQISSKHSVRFIQIGDLRNDKNLKYTEDSGVIVKKDDVIIAWDGANAGTIGYGLNGIIGSTLAKLEIQNEKINSQFFGKFLQGKFRYLRDQCTGATIPHISKNILTELKIPLPSLEEQKRIVKELDQADNLRKKRKQAIALLDEYLKSVFLEMFGDPVVNEKGFKTDFLENMYINKKEGTKCGPFGSALKKNEYVNNGIPVWTMYNIKGMNFSSNDCLYITKEKYNELISYKTVNGDIIISRAGTVGKMAIVNSEHSKSIISTNLIKLSLNKEKLIPLYFVSLMDYCKGGVGRLKTGQDGTFTHMNTGVLNQLNFPIPPIELQNKFANVAKKTEQLKQSMLSQSEELDTNFNALMQEAFVEDF